MTMVIINGMSIVYVQMYIICILLMYNLLLVACVWSLVWSLVCMAVCGDTTEFYSI